jgi:hypothetical protein
MLRHPLKLLVFVLQPSFIYKPRFENGRISCKMAVFPAKCREVKKKETYLLGNAATSV